MKCFSLIWFNNEKSPSRDKLATTRKFGTNKRIGLSIVSQVAHQQDANNIENLQAAPHLNLSGVNKGFLPRHSQWVFLSRRFHGSFNLRITRVYVTREDIWYFCQRKRRYWIFLSEFGFFFFNSFWLNLFFFLEISLGFPSLFDAKLKFELLYLFKNLL